MSTPLLTDSVDASDWRDRVSHAHADGFTYFDFLTVIERESNKHDSEEQSPVFEIVVRVTQPNFVDALTLSTVISSAEPKLMSIAEIYPGADWHERECSEMFGIHFAGNSSRALLRHETVGTPPLRKSVVLSSRVIVEWPGAAEPEIKDDGRKVGNPSRRRQKPPGVPDHWLQS